MRIIAVLALALVGLPAYGQIAITLDDVVGEFGSEFSLVRADEQWGRPVRLFSNAERVMVMAVGRDGAEDVGQVTAVSMTGFSIPPDRLTYYAAKGRTLLSIVMDADEEMLAWYDEWRATIGTDEGSRAEKVAQGITVALAYQPGLEQLSITLSNEGDSLGH